MKLTAALSLLLIPFLAGCTALSRAEKAANTPSDDLGGKTPLQVLGVSAATLMADLPMLVEAIRKGEVPVAIEVAGRVYENGSEAWRAIWIVIEAVRSDPAYPPEEDQKKMRAVKPTILWRFS